MFGKSVDTLSAQFKSLLLEGLTPIIESISKFTTTFSEFLALSPKIRELVGQIATAVASFAALFVGLIAIGIVVPLIATGLATLGTIALGIAGVLAAPWVVISLGIATAAVAVYKFRDDIALVMGQVVTVIATQIYKIEFFFKELLPAALGLLVDKVKLSFNNVVLSIQKSLTQLLTKTADALNAAGFDGLASNLDRAAEGIRDSSYKIIQDNISIAEGAEDMQGRLIEAYESIEGKAAMIGESAQMGFVGLTETVETTLTDLSTRLQTFVETNAIDFAKDVLGIDVADIKAKIAAATSAANATTRSGNQKMLTDKKRTLSDITSADKAALRAQLGNTKDNLRELGKHSKAAFVAYKAFAIAEAVISTYQGAQNAYTSLSSIPIIGPALGIAAAVIAVGAGLARVAAISSQQAPSAATGGLIRGAGTGTSDSIPTNLSDGEFVLRAQAVRNIGADNLARINQAGSLDSQQAPANTGSVTSIENISITIAANESVEDRLMEANLASVNTFGVGFIPEEEFAV